MKLEKIQEKVEKNIRLNFEDAKTLFESNNIIAIGKMANQIRVQKHQKKAYFIYNQHLNYTNICKNKCLFCAYAKDANEEGSFLLSIKDVEKELVKNISQEVKEIHIVGGLNEALDFQYFIDLLKIAKKIRPNACIKAFTAVEIDYLSQISNMSIKETISKLKEAGLEMMPGGGAEVLNSKIHKKLFPRKINHEKWLSIMEEVHKKNIKTNATMLYGHIESYEDRIEHLFKLRDLQDKTNGFLSFIPLSFQPKNTKLSHIKNKSGYDDLKTIAISRLILDNFDHIKAYWVMLGVEIAQLALYFGADDLDGTIMEEKIAHMAGATTKKGLVDSELKKLIFDAGFIPTQRDSFYNEL